MLGSVAEADDVLQEAFLRFDRASAKAEAGEGAPIESPRSYLSAVVTRLAIDELRSARKRRESYVGVWLPEPLVGSQEPVTGERVADPEAEAEMADSLSMAFLLVLDRLNPVERAVFLLHDVFGYEFGEIAPIVERTEANCRQIAARARKRVHDNRPQLDPPSPEREQVATQFVRAMKSGDLDGLVGLLAHDVVVYGDGGGKAPQWSTPITGIERVAKLVAGLARQIAEYGVSMHTETINGQPGLVFRTATGDITNVFEIEISDGLVSALRGVINPDKLRHLGPVADVRAMAAERAHHAS